MRKAAENYLNFSIKRKQIKKENFKRKMENLNIKRDLRDASNNYNVQTLFLSSFSK